MPIYTRESAVSQQAAQEEKIQSPSSVRWLKLLPYILRLTPFLIISIYKLYISQSSGLRLTRLLSHSFVCRPLMCCYNSNICRDDHYRDKKQQQGIIIVNQHLIGIRSPKNTKQKSANSLSLCGCRAPCWRFSQRSTRDLTPHVHTKREWNIEGPEMLFEFRVRI